MHRISSRRRARTPVPWPRRMLSWVNEFQRRERTLLLEETTRFRDLMPVLMKPRNGERWTRDDRTQIKARLRDLRELSPWIVLLALPGGFLFLPLFAWWLDRRKKKRVQEGRT